jgi:hypothetical protein
MAANLLFFAQLGSTVRPRRGGFTVHAQDLSDAKRAKLFRILQSKEPVRFANPNQLKKALHKLGPEWGEAPVVVDGGPLSPDNCWIRSDWLSDMGPLKARWAAVPEVCSCAKLLQEKARCAAVTLL